MSTYVPIGWVKFKVIAEQTLPCQPRWWHCQKWVVYWQACSSTDVQKWMY